MLFVRYMSFSFSYAPVFFSSKFSLACIIVQVLLKFATSIRLVLFLFLHQFVLLICFWYFFSSCQYFITFFPQIYIYIYINYAVWINFIRVFLLCDTDVIMITLVVQSLIYCRLRLFWFGSAHFMFGVCYFFFFIFCFWLGIYFT